MLYAYEINVMETGKSYELTEEGILPKAVISHQLYESREEARKAGEMRAPVELRALARQYRKEVSNMWTTVEVLEFKPPKRVRGV